jgi:hypothetical protein
LFNEVNNQKIMAVKKHKATAFQLVRLNRKRLLMTLSILMT